MSGNTFVYGSFVMVVVNIIVRVIDFTYGVMLSKFLGAEAMGLFQMSMSILMIFLTVSIAGIPTAISRLVAEQNSKGNHFATKRILKTAIYLVSFLSSVFSLILILFGESISFRIFKNEDMLLAIYLLIPSIFIISVSSILRGYYYGLKNMLIPGISQIIEHITRFILILGFLYFVYPVAPLYGALIAIVGITLGEVFDLIWLLIMLKSTNKKMISINIRRISGPKILRQILPIAVPIGVSGFLNVIIRFFSSILIPQKLMISGYTNGEAIATFGRITGMAMPLIMIPFTVTSAIVTNLIPNLSEQMALKNYKNIRNNIIFSLKITLLISIPLTGFYLCFAENLGSLLYGDHEVGRFIQAMSYGTVCLALQNTFSGVLHGLNKQIAVTANNLLGMMIQLLCIYYLVGDPRFGITGFFIGFLSSGVIVCLLDMITIRKVIKLKIDTKDIILKPLVATIVMIIVVSYSMDFLHGFYVGDILTFVFSSIIGIGSYALVLYMTKAIPKNFLKRLIR